MKKIVSSLLLLLTLLHGRAQVTYVGTQPGKSTVKVQGGSISLSNNVLNLKFASTAQSVSVVSFSDRAGKEVIRLPKNSPLFVIVLADGSRMTSRDFTLRGRVSSSVIAAQPGAPVLAHTMGGTRVGATFDNEQLGLTVSWEAELRHGSNYVRQVASFLAKKPVEISRFEMIAIPGGQNISTIGTVDGSPMAAGNMFFAVEHPLSKIDKTDSSSIAYLPRSLPLIADSAFVVSSVWGITPPKQMRRGFLYYVERERAHPYRQFLHYNSWFDLSYEDMVLNDSVCLDRIKVFGDSLITKRQVPMQAFLFDDGWDDYKTLWQFNKGFPDGFTNVRNAAAKYHAGIGVWMSPWGGYDIRKPQRLEYGAKQNPPFETNENGFSLAGPVYYKRFSEVTADFITKYNVSIFKFDGVGAGNGLPGATGQYQRDIESLLRLIHGLRALKPDIFLSLTIGTWPSAYWLNHGDVIWRSGDDTGLKGKGTKRQQWMNYRDAETYQNIVQRAPLYPLSSLMYHGLCISNRGTPGTLEMDDDQVADEMWSFFATGTSLEEMYVNPHKLNAANWDELARAIRWARSRKDAMPDVHWVGGDPAKEEVYGFAAWSAGSAYVVLRNPSDEAKSFEVNVSKIFDLSGTRISSLDFFDARAQAADGKKHRVAGGSTFTLTLRPFDVKVLDAQAVQKK